MTGFTFRRSDFPEGFTFGAATSSYQIEGRGAAGPTHWDSFAAAPGNVVGREDGARACDHLNRWPEDLDLLAGAGLDAYRFSTSWARVMPDGRQVAAAGLDFYDKLVDGMLARGIAPHLTLYHWELPAALADRGGWANGDIAAWFADFAMAVAGRLGDRLASIATINEPWCVAWLSHFEGAHAPGLRDIRATARAMHHVLLAHGTAVTALRAAGHTGLGLVTNMEFADPADDSPAAARAAATYDAIYNRWFLEGVFRKTYPEAALAGLGPHLPAGWEADFDTIAAPLDWVGLNYYTRKRLADDGSGLFPGWAERPGPLPKTAMGWEIYAPGIAAFLTRMARDYTGDLPLYVTENGMAGDDRRVGQDVPDPARIAYLDAHLHAVRQAMAAGAPVKGYFFWSLLDNYEWAFGYDKRFGLIHVDFETLERTPKHSYHALRAALMP